MVWCSKWSDCDFCAKFGNNLLNISKVVGRKTKCLRFLAYPVGLSGNETNKQYGLLAVSYFTRILADESGFDHGDKWENSRLYCFTAKNCTKIVHLIIMKIIRIVATRCQILKLKCIKFDFGWGSAPDPAGGAYSAPQTPSWWGGGWLPLLKNPTTLSALRASHLGPSGLTPSVRASKLFTFINPWSWCVLIGHSAGYSKFKQGIEVSGSARAMLYLLFTPNFSSLAVLKFKLLSIKCR